MIQPRFYVSTDAADSATARRFQKHMKPRAEEAPAQDHGGGQAGTPRPGPAHLLTSSEKFRRRRQRHAATSLTEVRGRGQALAMRTLVASETMPRAAFSGIAASSASRRRAARAPSGAVAPAARQSRRRGQAARRRARAQGCAQGGAQGAKRAKPADSMCRTAQLAHAAPPTAAARTAATASPMQPDGFRPVDGRRHPGWKRKRKLGQRSCWRRRRRKARAPCANGGGRRGRANRRAGAGAREGERHQER